MEKQRILTTVMYKVIDHLSRFCLDYILRAYLGILNLFNLFETIIDANVGLYIGVSVVLLISLIFVLLIIKKTAKSDKMKKSVEGMQFINGNNQKYIVIDIK